MIPRPPSIPSPTAVGSALLRAVHLLVDDGPPIVRDAYALALAGQTDLHAVARGFASVEESLAQQMPVELAVGLVRGLRAVTVLRARLAQDLLERAASRGTRQCIVLGAGLDSIAYRVREDRRDVTFFEVDQEPTQQWKKLRLDEIGIPVEHVRFVPLDLQRGGILSALAGAGLDSTQPAFVIWLGVTPYLSPDDVARNLADLAALPRGSEIFFDFIVPDELLDDVGVATVTALRRDMAEHGEPGATVFHPDVMLRLLDSRGWRPEELFDERGLNARYFSARRDRLALPVPCSARWILATNC